MKRRLVTLAAAASLLLCIATVALWVSLPLHQSGPNGGGAVELGSERRLRADWEPKVVELDTRRFRSRIATYSEAINALGSPDLIDDRWVRGSRIVYFYDDRSVADAAAELLFDDRQVLTVVNYYPDSRKLDRRGLQPNQLRVPPAR